MLYKEDNKNTTTNKKEEKKENDTKKKEQKKIIKKPELKKPLDLKPFKSKRVPNYVSMLFDKYCLSVNEVTINVSKMTSTKNSNYGIWKNIFVTNDATWINSQVFVKIFPNLNKLRINYYYSTLKESTFKHLLSFLQSNDVKGRDFDFELCKPVNIDFDDNNIDDDNNKDDNNNPDISLVEGFNKYIEVNVKNNSLEWFGRLNMDPTLPYISMIRPQNADETMKGLSNILNENEISLTMKLLKNHLSQIPEYKTTFNRWYLKLLYRASRDTFDSSVFHKKCDEKGQTLTIIKVENSKNIFGGFTSKAWTRSGGYCDDPNSCLFLIKDNNGSNDNAQHFKLKSTEYSKYGALHSRNGGPGFGENDIKILNRANKSNKNSCYPRSFNFSLQPINQLTGCKGGYFKVENYEVFHVNFF